MKNLLKVVGIIAVLAIIGVVSCEVNPDDQTTITITNIPGGANNMYATMWISDSKDLQGNNKEAYAAAIRKISGGSVTCEMLNTKGEAFGKNDNYYIMIKISTDSSGNTVKYTGNSTSKKNVKKGAVSYDANIFEPIIDDVFGEAQGEPPRDFFGTYTGTGYQQGVVETVIFARDSFRISDNSNTPVDYLDFTITSWDDTVTVPVAYRTNYDTAYKFTGKITGAKPIETNALYGSQTAPGFTQADINTTVCHMYIYCKDDSNGFSFIRTTFSKETSSDVTTAVTVTGTNNLRVFTKSN